jgi:hypothetical protein
MLSGLQNSNGDEFQNDAIFICIGNDDIHVVHRDLPQTIDICTIAEKNKKYNKKKMRSYYFLKQKK